LAAEIEGHPDNVAPCLLGGFTIAWTSDDGAYATRLDVSPEITPTVLIPETRGLTAHARAALPQQIPHRDAVFNVARAALLVHALTRDPSLLLTATEDRLHQNYRASGQPETAALVSALRKAGGPAVVSGRRTERAGPFRPADSTGRMVGQVTVDRLDRGAYSDTRHAEGDPVAAGLPS
jgi:homoserine kinase